MNIRKSVVSGSFYPDKKEELLKYINQFNSFKTNNETFENIKAIIVPHAGYVYSGFTANLAYFSCKNKNPKRVIVIGPSHRVYLKGASVSLYDEYETPLGNILIDKKFSENLIKEYDFLDFNIECEFEHSTETQMPFIKHYFKDSLVVEIVYGDIDFKTKSQNNEKVEDSNTLQAFENLQKEAESYNSKSTGISDEAIDQTIKKVERSKSSVQKEKVTTTPVSTQKEEIVTKKVETKKSSIKDLVETPSENTISNSMSSGYFIQIGAFTKKPTDNYVSTIRNAKLKYKIYQDTVNGVAYNKVLIGQYSTKAAASENVEDVKK